MDEPTFIPTEQQLDAEIKKLDQRVKTLEDKTRKVLGELADRRAQSDAIGQNMGRLYGQSAKTSDLDEVVGVLARALLAREAGVPVDPADKATLEQWSART